MGLTAESRAVSLSHTADEWCSLFRAKLDAPASEIAARGHMLLLITAGCRVHVL